PLLGGEALPGGRPLLGRQGPGGGGVHDQPGRPPQLHPRGRLRRERERLPGLRGGSDPPDRLPEAEVAERGGTVSVRVLLSVRPFEMTTKKKAPWDQEEERRTGSKERVLNDATA